MGYAQHSDIVNCNIGGFEARELINIYSIN